jgi:pimeloyl-ACP methyl ester carboxylesterase
MDTTTTTGYADVNGLHLYYETTGSGTPVVLLHGGMLNIELGFPDLVPELAPRHQVIAVELQGHGRTADIDREITPASSASDVVGLLDHLGLERAHVVGHSMGAAVAIELAVSHPDRVLSIVPISATVRPEGMHEDFSDPEKMAVSTRMPTAEDFEQMQSTYRRLSPHPDRFEELLAAITAPTLFVIGDHDFTTVPHAALMLELVPGSQLAVLPGTTHMQAPRRTDLLAPMLQEFLDRD